MWGILLLIIIALLIFFVIEPYFVKKRQKWLLEKIKTTKNKEDLKALIYDYLAFEPHMLDATPQSIADATEQDVNLICQIMQELADSNYAHIKFKDPECNPFDDSYASGREKIPFSFRRKNKNTAQ